MTTSEREIHIRLCFEVLYPGRAIDFIYPNDDQIYVYADNLTSSRILHPMMTGSSISCLWSKVTA
jgi:hypothetical protein